MKQSILAILMVLACGLIVMAAGNAGDTSLPATANDYKILAPITHGDLTIFPVVSDKIHDTSNFITLDAGIRSGDVVVTEVGNLHSTMRRRPPYQARPYSGAEVNRLVLVNNSKHPLILLAGEVVTGGKQDRVVGKDRIVPAEKRSRGPFRFLRGARTLDGDFSKVRYPCIRNAATQRTREGDGGKGPAESLGRGWKKQGVYVGRCSDGAVCPKRGRRQWNRLRGPRA